MLLCVEAKSTHLPLKSMTFSTHEAFRSFKEFQLIVLRVQPQLYCFASLSPLDCSLQLVRFRFPCRFPQELVETKNRAKRSWIQDLGQVVLNRTPNERSLNVGCVKKQLFSNTYSHINLKMHLGYFTIKARQWLKGHNISLISHLMWSTYPQELLRFINSVLMLIKKSA